MKLFDQIKKDFSYINFINSDKFKWSPETNTIFYDAKANHADWSILHEIGHKIAGHQNYSSDIGLIKMEVEAWEQARQLAGKYRYEIDESYIEKCLDSYRDWIYKRSSCPTCTQAGVEEETGQYKCINCQRKWKVTNERFCRVYRKTVEAQA